MFQSFQLDFGIGNLQSQVLGFLSNPFVGSVIIALLAAWLAPKIAQVLMKIALGGDEVWHMDADEHAYNNSIRRHEQKHGWQNTVVSRNSKGQLEYWHNGKRGKRLQ
jgi:hypothetical protein